VELFSARRVYITGGPGGGKTTLARLLSQALEIEVFELDDIFLRNSWDLDAVVNHVSALAEAESWIADGAYMAWTGPLFERADVVVHTDVPWRVASYRNLVEAPEGRTGAQQPLPGLAEALPLLALVGPLLRRPQS
jgi:adenylate kinase family enzyme